MDTVAAGAVLDIATAFHIITMVERQAITMATTIITMATITTITVGQEAITEQEAIAADTMERGTV